MRSASSKKKKGIHSSIDNSKRRDWAINFSCEIYFNSFPLIGETNRTENTAIQRNGKYPFYIFISRKKKNKNDSAKQFLFFCSIPIHLKRIDLVSLAFCCIVCKTILLFQSPSRAIYTTLYGTIDIGSHRSENASQLHFNNID